MKHLIIALILVVVGCTNSVNHQIDNSEVLGKWSNSTISYDFQSNGEYLKGGTGQTEFGKYDVVGDLIEFENYLYEKSYELSFSIENEKLTIGQEILIKQ